MSDTYNPTRRPQRQAPARVQVNGFKDLDQHVQVTRKQPQPQPAPLEFKGETNKWYETKRNGSVKRVFLVEVKKDIAYYKDLETDQHTQSMSLAKFIKFYG